MTTRAAVLHVVLVALAAHGCFIDVDKKALLPPGEDAAPDQASDLADHDAIPDPTETRPDQVDSVLEDADLPPVDGCAPETCTSLGVECGDFDNGCGGIVVCWGCPSDEFECADGVCICPYGLERCSTECADLASNNSHCGECGHECPAGWLCAEGSCKPECPAGWRTSVVSEESGFAYCYSEYQGNDNCCLAWSRCGMLDARPGWGWGSDVPSELAGLVPVIVLRARTDMVEGDCNYACYVPGTDGTPLYSGSRSYYGCTAGDLCFSACDSSSCNGASLEDGCACQVPYWCYIQIGPT